MVVPATWSSPGGQLPALPLHRSASSSHLLRCTSSPALPCLPPPPPPHTHTDDYRKEQLDYFSHTAAWTDIHPSQVVGTAAVFKTYDLHTLTLEELKAPLNVS